VTRSRSRSQDRDIPAPSSGKWIVLFGGLTILALMIIGWVLVNGGFVLPDKGVFGNLLSSEAGEKVTTDDFKATIEQYEKRIQDLQETHQKEISAIKEQYQQQIDELNMQIKILQDENDRLREPEK
jgi:hypothetical protein